MFKSYDIEQQEAQVRGPFVKLTDADGVLSMIKFSSAVSFEGRPLDMIELLVEIDSPFALLLDPELPLLLTPPVPSLN